MIETERLLLRKINPKDYDAVLKMLTDENVGPMVGKIPGTSLEEYQRDAKTYVNKDNTYAIILKENQKLIGTFGIHHDYHDSKKTTKMVGIILNPEYWGNGYAPETLDSVINYLFTKTDCKRITSGHFGSNFQTKRVLEKVGFRYVTYYPKDFKREDGISLDVIYYSLSKDDYLNK